MGDRDNELPPSRPVAPLRVILDAGPAVHQGAGLSRYTERLAAHLHSDPRVDLTLFYNAHSGHTLPPALADLPQRSISLGQYAWRLSALASQLVRWPYYERRIPPGQLYHATEHLLPRLKRPTVLTVHDLIFEHYPQHHTRSNRAFLKLGMPVFVRAADAIIAVSHNSKQDLIHLYGVPDGKIHVVHEGIDRHFRPVDAACVQRVRARYSPDRPYLLMVGTLEPRKNHAAAMRALARLKADGRPHRLLIVGGKGWLFDPVRQLVEGLGLARDVVFAGYVDDQELPALYAGADCFILPSLYEGFGLPALEAMACGTPVVCSNASSLPEVVGDAALLVDPDDDAALTAALRRVLGEPALAASLRQAGWSRAARYRWETCADRTVAVYTHVLKVKNARPG